MALCLTMLLLMQSVSFAIPVSADGVKRVTLTIIKEPQDGEEAFSEPSEDAGESAPSSTAETEALPDTKSEETGETSVSETPEEEQLRTEDVEAIQYASNFPLYFQNDYPNVRYGKGTIATSGCGITALAMVATYMTGHDYYPDELAEYSEDYNSVSNLDRMMHTADLLQLPWHQAKSWNRVLEALENGNPVIALVDSNGKFTTEDHFIVLMGITEDERIRVYDPNRSNYSRWDMKEGFQKGFEQYDICAGYCGSWIFDMDAMPEDPFIYEPAETFHVKPRYPSINLTSQEMDLLARVVWVESRGEPTNGQQAVAEVVFNRLVAEGFPDDLETLIYAPGQFRSVPYLEDAEPMSTQYDAIERALNGPYVLPIDVYYFATEPMTDNVWGTIGGHTFCY